CAKSHQSAQGLPLSHPLSLCLRALPRRGASPASHDGRPPCRLPSARSAGGAEPARCCGVRKTAPMPGLEFGWFMPTRGHTDDYSAPLNVSAGLEMFDRVAIAAEKAGFEYS